MYKIILVFYFFFSVFFLCAILKKKMPGAIASNTNSRQYDWVLPAGLLLLLLVMISCSGSSSNSAVLLQKEDGATGNFKDKDGNKEVTTKDFPSNMVATDGKTSRKEIRNKVLGAYLDNHSSGFVRLGKTIKGKAGKVDHYPQFQHYFRTNENSFETIIQKKTKKQKDNSVKPLDAPMQEKESADTNTN